MAIKAKELAQKIGVSEATLSLVLNHKGGISKKTRDMVTEKVIAMGYSYMFKSSQESFEGEHTDTEGISLPAENGYLGFVIYQDTGLFMENTPFFPLIIDGMDMIARKSGYRLLVINIRRDMDLSTKLAYIKDSGCVGYVIYAPEFPEEEVDSLKKLRIPFVLLDNYFPGKDIDAVTLNNEQGIYAILNMLIEKGHREIGYLSSGVNIQSFRERRDSYKRLLPQMGLECNPEFFWEIGYPEQQAAEGMDKVLAQKSDLPTAFITDNDYVAYGAIKSLMAHGYSVPGDISVVGFSDRPVCMYIVPNITTVRIPRMRFGGEAVDMLINKVLKQPYDDEKSTVKTAISLELIMRDSVGKAPVH